MRADLRGNPYMVNTYTSELGMHLPQYFEVIPQNSGTICFRNTHCEPQSSALSRSAPRLDLRFCFLSKEERAAVHEFHGREKRIDIPRRKRPFGEEPHEPPFNLFSLSGYVRETPDAAPAKHGIPNEPRRRIAQRRINLDPASFRAAGKNPADFARKPDQPVRREFPWF